MGFAFLQVISRCLNVWLLTVLSKIYTTYHDLLPIPIVSFDLLGWLSSEILRLHVQGLMMMHCWRLIPQFDHTIWSLCIWWRWSSWYYLWIIPWSELWSFFFLATFFQCTFFHGAVVCFLFTNIIGLFLALTLGFYIQLPSFSCNFLYLFLIYFPRWILTIFADLFGCVKLCPRQLMFFASNIRAQN